MPRVLLAIVGASIVTVLLLLAMNEVTNKFRERDSARYFMVDFISPIDQGRQRVQRLQLPDPTTQRVQPDLASPDTTLPVGRPTIDDTELTPAPAAGVPELDAGNVGP